MLAMPIGSKVHELTKEVFYARHKFLIRLAGIGASASFSYPPKHLNTFIRRVDISINVRTRDWKLLAKIASGKMGFENLRDLTIWIFATGVWPTENNRQIEAARREIVKKPLVFKVKKLIVDYQLAKVLYRNGGTQAFKSRMIDLQAIEPLVFDSLRIESKLGADEPEPRFEEHIEVDANWTRRVLEI
jgi:hypothetical protein